MFYLRLFLILALCGLLVQPAQAEPGDSLALEDEHQAATPQKTEPKEITIYILGEHKAVVLALLEAVDEGTSVTGIADFDSLSATYGLMGIDRTGRMPSFYGHRFRLTFPPDADVAAIAGAYWNLSYVQSIENPVLLGHSYQRTRSPEAPLGDIENEQRTAGCSQRWPLGLLSGVVFTAIGFGVLASIDNSSYGNAHADISAFLTGMLIGISVGFPLGVTAVDPYDSLPKTLLAGVIPASAGYLVLAANQEREGTGFLLLYVGPIIGSLIASEKWRKPPQSRRVSFGLAPTLNGGLSAAATLRF